MKLLTKKEEKENKGITMGFKERILEEGEPGLKDFKTRGANFIEDKDQFWLAPKVAGHLAADLEIPITASMGPNPNIVKLYMKLLDMSDDNSAKKDYANVLSHMIGKTVKFPSYVTDKDSNHLKNEVVPAENENLYRSQSLNKILFSPWKQNKEKALMMHQDKLDPIDQMKLHDVDGMNNIDIDVG